MAADGKGTCVSKKNFLVQPHSSTILISLHCKEIRDVLQYKSQLVFFFYKNIIWKRVWFFSPPVVANTLGTTLRASCIWRKCRGKKRPSEFCPTFCPIFKFSIKTNPKNHFKFLYKLSAVWDKTCILNWGCT